MGIKDVIELAEKQGKILRKTIADLTKKPFTEQSLNEMDAQTARMNESKKELDEINEALDEEINNTEVKTHEIKRRN